MIMSLDIKDLLVYESRKKKVEQEESVAGGIQRAIMFITLVLYSLFALLFIA